MPKIVDPALLGRTPQLTPTARPLAVTIGATPPPRGNPIGELGQSLAGWFPILSENLRNQVATEEDQAATAAAAVARKEGAQAILDKTEAQLKDLADQYKIPHVRLPAFQRTLSMNVGMQLAQTDLQEGLKARMGEATAVTGDANSASHQERLNKIVAEEFTRVNQKLHPNDHYALRGFMESSSGIINQFQELATESYAANYQRVGETKLAQAGADVISQLAHADTDSTPTLLEAFKHRLDEVRSVYPKHDANLFAVKNMVEPIVNDLITQQKTSEARKVLNAVRGLDVTGSGGLLGKVSATMDSFDNMERAVRQAEVNLPHTELNRLQVAQQLATAQAESLLVDKLPEWKKGGTWLLDKSALEANIKSVEATMPDTHEGRAMAKAFREAATAQFNSDSNSSIDRTAAADFKAELDTYDPAKLDALTVQLASLKSGWKISPEEAAQFGKQLDRNKQLFGVVNAGEVAKFQNSAFIPVQGSAKYGEPDFMLFLGRENVDKVHAIWDDIEGQKATKTSPAISPSKGLSPGEKEKFQNDLNLRYKSNLMDEIRKRADPAKVAVEMDEIRRAATEKTQADGLVMLQQRAGRVATAAANAEKASDAEKKRKAEASMAVSPARFSFDYYTSHQVKARDGSTRTVTDRSTVDIPRAPDEVIRKNLKVVPSESDVAHIAGIEGGLWNSLSFRQVDMVALAKELPTITDPAAAKKAQETYAYAKSTLGFTPEEINSGVTKHGVQFNAAEIDPSVIPVWRDKAELDKNWNNGEPTELFKAIGNRVDQHDKLTAEQFYKTQSALLTRKNYR